MPITPRNLSAPPDATVGIAPPGAVSVPYQPNEVMETWRMLASDPFSSPETQRFAENAVLYYGTDVGGPQDLPLERVIAQPEPTRVSQVVQDHSPQVPAGSSGNVDWYTGGGGVTYSGQSFTHPTDGLDGFPAVDIFARPGTPFLAPEDGSIVRHSGRGGTSGNVYGYSLYFKGKSGRLYFITHLNRARAPVGKRVKKGRPIGSISPWSGGSPHAHVGVRG